MVRCATIEVHNHLELCTAEFCIVGEKLPLEGFRGIIVVIVTVYHLSKNFDVCNGKLVFPEGPSLETRTEVSCTHTLRQKKNMWVSGFPTLPSFWTSKSRP